MSALRLTVFGCERDEAELFSEVAPRFGVVPTLVEADPSHAGRAAGSRCVSVGHRSDVSARTLRALHDAGVEHISTRSIGLDHIDLRAAHALGMTVENVSYAPDGVADYTLMLILMSIRDATRTTTAARNLDFRLAAARSRDLRDMTVGVLGVGSIGSAVIRRLSAFGCRVLANNGGRIAHAAAEFTSLDELLVESDIVTLHLPLNDETHHIIGRAQLEMMKHDALLINTGRGALVDTSALVAALERGHLGGAALDVVEGEDAFFYADHSGRPAEDELLVRLLKLSNVIVTPHTAYFTQRALRDTVAGTLVKCVRFERSRTNDEEAEDRDLVRGLL
ncbi:MAG: D-lactate dehydrogenase VanH [Ilumatobacteraceae bacterium]|nr:D-lactate dehydrogenase VanH [Ilumatobacteraceae bacterium]